MPVAISCFGGVNEIGGNKLFFEDKDTRVFFDFGAGFSEGLDYFSSGIEPPQLLKSEIKGKGEWGSLTTTFGFISALRDSC
jgi:predicted metal-dependent RNase